MFIIKTNCEQYNNRQTTVVVPQISHLCFQKKKCSHSKATKNCFHNFLSCHQQTSMHITKTTKKQSHYVTILHKTQIPTKEMSIILTFWGKNFYSSASIRSPHEMRKGKFLRTIWSLLPFVKWNSPFLRFYLNSFSSSAACSSHSSSDVTWRRSSIANNRTQLSFCTSLNNFLSIATWASHTKAKDELLY